MAHAGPPGTRSEVRRLDVGPFGSRIYLESPAADELLPIVADKAYGNAQVRQSIADKGALTIIPAESNARKPIPHDANLYAQRNIVERFFCEMKDMCRLAARYEKLGRNFTCMQHLFAIRC